MKVRFLPQNVEFEIQPNQSVMNLAQENGLFIKSVCKGIPNCAECRVRIREGEHNVLPPSSAELALIGTAYFVDRRRLSCQIRCFGDITVDLSEQEEKRVSHGKRPRGKGPRDASESFAVRGNMMDEREAERIAAQANVSLLAAEAAVETEEDEDGDEGEDEEVVSTPTARGGGPIPRQQGPQAAATGPGPRGAPSIGGSREPAEGANNPRRRRRRRRRRAGGSGPHASSSNPKSGG